MMTAPAAKQKASEIRLELLAELQAVTLKSGTARDAAMDDIDHRTQLLNALDPRGFGVGGYAASEND